MTFGAANQRFWCRTLGCWAMALTLLVACSRNRETARTESVVVAAIQYGNVNPGVVEGGCGRADHRCALEALIRRAAKQGAKLVVLPEYALAQAEPELLPPRTGVAPDPRRAPIAARFAQLARDLGIYLVINLITKSGDDQRNTQLAFDGSGRIVGWHHKFELFAGEKAELTPGERVTAFDTPFGRVGLLICADMYGAPRKHARLTRERGARIIAVSSQWTVPHAGRWPAAFARDWGVHVVAANSGLGAASGSGVYAPTGRALASSGKDEWGVVLAEIPVRR